MDRAISPNLKIVGWKEVKVDKNRTLARKRKIGTRVLSKKSELPTEESQGSKSEANESNQRFPVG